MTKYVRDFRETYVGFKQFLISTISPRKYICMINHFYGRIIHLRNMSSNVVSVPTDDYLNWLSICLQFQFQVDFFEEILRKYIKFMC